MDRQNQNTGKHESAAFCLLNPSVYDGEHEVQKQDIRQEPRHTIQTGIYPVIRNPRLKQCDVKSDSGKKEEYICSRCAVTQIYNQIHHYGTAHGNDVKRIQFPNFFPREFQAILIRKWNILIKIPDSQQKTRQYEKVETPIAAQ